LIVWNIFSASESDLVGSGLYLTGLAGAISALAGIDALRDRSSIVIEAESTDSHPEK
jgi:hypothetical protein